MSKRKRINSSAGIEDTSVRRNAQFTSNDVCLRCSEVLRSSRIDNPKGGNGESILQIQESHETLRASSCQVCQLLALLKTPALDDLSSSLCVISAKWLFTRKISKYPDRSDTSLFFVESDVNLAKFKTRGHMGHVLAIEELSKSNRFLQPQSIDHEKIQYSLIRRWLEYCEKYHSASCKPEILRQPHTFKVIDCWQKTIIPMSSSCSYAALSYVWGVTNSGIPADPDTWPQVVNDSIAVALQVKCDYLWVDKLCIDQENRLLEMGRMDEIYSGAAFTIIDATGDDSSHGLSGVTPTRRSQPSLIDVTINDVRLTYLRKPPKEKIGSSRWASRGWTYQEGILSPRRIFFTSDQVMFQCNKMQCFEAFEIPMDALKKSKGNDAIKQPPLRDIEPISMAKQRLVDHMVAYSKRDLTNDNDSLNAFLGILRHYSGSGKEYVHFLGSPIDCSKKTIINSWYHPEPAQRRDQFPSWSWTGWKGGIKLTSRDNPDHKVRLLAKARYQISVERYIEAYNHYQTLPMKHAIEITGEMTKLSFTHIRWSSEPDIKNAGLDVLKLRDGPWAVLPLTEDLRCYSLLYLDDASMAAERQDDLPAIVLEFGKESKNHNIVILVLEEASRHYRRVGLIVIRHRFATTSDALDEKGQPKQVVYRNKAGDWLPMAPISEPSEQIWLQRTERKTVLVE